MALLKNKSQFHFFFFFFFFYIAELLSNHSLAPALLFDMADSSPLPVPRTGPGDAPKDPGIASNCHQSYTEKDFEGKKMFFPVTECQVISMCVCVVLETVISITKENRWRVIRQ